MLTPFFAVRQIVAWHAVWHPQHRLSLGETPNDVQNIPHAFMNVPGQSHRSGRHDRNYSTHRSIHLLALCPLGEFLLCFKNQNDKGVRGCQIPNGQHETYAYIPPNRYSTRAEGQPVRGTGVNAIALHDGMNTRS